MEQRDGANRRKAIGIAAAIAVGAATILLVTQSPALGSKSGQQGNERVEICHEGKTLKVYDWELGNYPDATLGKCPKG